MASASTAGVPADPHGGTTMERFARAQAVMADSQAAVDALAGFLAARAELESMYAKNLQKLAKMGLDIRGTRTRIRRSASVRADVCVLVRARLRAHSKAGGTHPLTMLLCTGTHAQKIPSTPR
ncbi:hypothetical protein EON66_04165 [archaeon]|nr:MAG: hypothetical protein EON66_04165 [archaeon]